MLVFLSDIHLTDGSSGTQIAPRAFKKFCELLLNIIGQPSETKINKVEVVLLGDIFDVIRSDIWLREANNLAHPIRPWSAPGDQDAAGWDLQMYAEEIVTKIIRNRQNQEAIGYLKAFEKQCAQDLGIKLVVSYLIGNHDWLLNRYPSTRQAIADFLGLTPPGHYATSELNHFRLFDSDGYPVCARHGDCYDPFNFEGNRDASSLGDAIVIDLLNKFPKAVADSPLGSNPILVKQLKEIDNVRPLWQIPAWIMGLCRRFPEAEDQLHEIWNGLVDDFCAIDFVKEHHQWGLETALHLSGGFSFEQLKEIADSWIAQKLFSNSDNYHDAAYKETFLQQGQARYVVYGHTHHAEQVPLDLMPPTTGGVTEALYFNTGTWRKVFEHTVYDEDSLEFIGWYVMTFVVFYLPSEKEIDREYEVWSASLGYGS